MVAMLTCSKCRSVQAPAPFCSTCGASLLVGGIVPAIPPPPGARHRGPQTSGMAITGFVLSFFCGVLGLIFSIIGFRECRKSQGKVTGEGLAIAGIVISILATILSVFLWLWFMRSVDDMKMSRRTPEARRALQRMATRVHQHHITTGELPTMIAPFTPPGSCCDNPGGRCEGDFSTPAWREIGFDLYGSQYFRYRYTSTRDTFEAVAVGDLDCDGDEIEYRLVMKVRNGVLDETLVEPTEED
jgi:hypothetical protein